MSAGTIKLINNTKTVSGTDTFFSQDLKVGDCIVATVGQVPYTLAVESVVSNVSLQLVQPYDGPGADALAWQVVPLGTMVRVASQLLQQVSYATRGYNLDKGNWQKIFSDESPVTVNLPDGTSYSGPSWLDITDQLAVKADKKTFDELNRQLAAKAAAGNNADITSLTGLKNPLSVTQGGTGAQSGPNACNNIGAFPATGGKVNGFLTADGDIHGAIMYSDKGVFYSDAYSDTENAHFWLRGATAVSRAVLYSNRLGVTFLRVDEESKDAMGYGFSFTSTGTFNCSACTQTSDRRCKSDVISVTDALDKISKLSGVTYDLRVTEDVSVRSAGIIAQDVEAVLPEAVRISGTGFDASGNLITDVKGGDYSALSALYVEAIKELKDRLGKLEERFREVADL